MKSFNVAKDSSIKIILLLLFLLFLVFSLVLREPFCLFVVLVVFLCYIIFYCQRELFVEITDTSIKITKLPSKLLRQCIIEIPFDDICRISRVNAPYKTFIVIKRKSGKDFNMPAEINPELDKYLLGLHKKLMSENEDYNTNNTKQDIINNNLFIIFVFAVIFSFIADAVAIYYLKFHPLTAIIMGVSFIPAFIILFILTKKG